MSYSVLFAICLIVIVLQIISLQRSFLLLDENISDAMSQIGVQLSSRWDTLEFLLELIKGITHDEYEQITQIINKRCFITKYSTSTDVKKQDALITEAVKEITAIANSYSNLADDETYIKIMDALKQYRNMIQTSTLIYNDHVTKLNSSIRRFPVAIFAKVFGFSKRGYIELVE